MDLRLLEAEPTLAEREAIDAVVGAAEPNGNRIARSDRGSRHLLLPALRAAQRRVGWVSEGALGYAARRLPSPAAGELNWIRSADKFRPSQNARTWPASLWISPRRIFPRQRGPITRWFLRAIPRR